MKKNTSLAMNEKRLHKRFPVEGMDINVMMLSAREVKVLDISVGGVSLKADRRFDIGSKYSVNLKYKDKVLSLKGVVVWSALCELRKATTGGSIPIYRAGIKLTDFSTDGLNELIDSLASYRHDNLEAQAVSNTFESVADGLACTEAHAEVRQLLDHLSGMNTGQQLSSVKVFEAILSALSDGISIQDKDLKVLYQNPAHKSLAGNRKGEHCYFAYEKRGKVCGGCPVVLSFRDGKIHKLERNAQAHNRTIHVEIIASPLRDPAGRIIAGIEVVREITEKKIREEELRALLLVDDLTGLYNRRGFFTLTEHLLKRVNREKKKIFMLYADLDGLKTINDQYGHQAGDQALKDVARVLKSTYRESDIIARIGGDEFVVVSAGTGGDNEHLITSRLSRNLEIHNSTTKSGIRLSVSLGIGSYDPEHPCSIEELLTEADKSMYAQKKNRQGRKLHTFSSVNRIPSVNEPQVSVSLCR